VPAKATPADARTHDDAAAVDVDAPSAKQRTLDVASEFASVAGLGVKVYDVSADGYAIAPTGDAVAADHVGEPE